jgi:hypothetical protein
MKNPFDDESSGSFALINAEGQHSLVPPLPTFRPAGRAMSLHLVGINHPQSQGEMKYGRKSTKRQTEQVAC